MNQIMYALLVVLAMVLFFSLLIQKTVTHPIKHQQAITYGIFTLYVIANLYLTIFSRIGDSVTQINLVPLWSYRAGILSVFHGKFSTEESPMKQILLNVLLYVPIGYLLPMIWPDLIRGPTGRYTIWKILCIGACASISTEAIQLMFQIGWFDIDDIINNTLGAVAGVLLYIGNIRKVKL